MTTLPEANLNRWDARVRAEYVARGRVEESVRLRGKGPAHSSNALPKRTQDGRTCRSPSRNGTSDRVREAAARWEAGKEDAG